MVDSDRVSEPALKAAGARALLRQGKTAVQVIIGPEADLISDEIRQEVERGVGRAAPAPAAASVAATDAGPLDPDPTRWIAVFGGAGNVAALDAVATTRLRIVVRDVSAVDRSRLDALDVAWVVPIPSISSWAMRPSVMRRCWAHACRPAARRLSRRKVRSLDPA